MFAVIGKILPTAAILYSLALILTTPDPVSARFDPEDCVYNPNQTCCTCMEDPRLCIEWEFSGVEYCSDRVCPEEDPCPPV